MRGARLLFLVALLVGACAPVGPVFDHAYGGTVLGIEEGAPTLALVDCEGGDLLSLEVVVDGELIWQIVRGESSAKVRLLPGVSLLPLGAAPDGFDTRVPLRRQVPLRSTSIRVLWYVDRLITDAWFDLLPETGAPAGVEPGDLDSIEEVRESALTRCRAINGLNDVGVQRL